jgi:hypothetical protein
MTSKHEARLFVLTGLCAIALACGIQLIVAGASHAQGRAPKGTLAPVPAEDLNWPLPPGIDKSYDAVDGNKLHSYVEELAAISERYRDAGNQLWGRIDGTSSMVEAQKWLKAKFDAIPGVTTQVVTIPDPRDLPKSWEVSVLANGKTVKLESAFTPIDFTQSVPSMKGDEELDAVWVGLGQESDFLGRDVRGKAVFIYSIAPVGNLVQSADYFNAVGRAERAGAAALLVDIAIPGNGQYVSHIDGQRVPGLKIPIFTIGDRDGATVQELYAANRGNGVKAHLRWEVESHPDATEDIVVAKLPGMTDEKIISLAHMDGYFDASIDDGGGTATLIGTAEFFAKMPKEQRRRTMYFVSVADHHDRDRSGQWLHDSMKSIFAKTVFINNMEHPSVRLTAWDREPLPGGGYKVVLVQTNGRNATWWGVYGSDKLAHIVAHDYAMFGIVSDFEMGGMGGQIDKVEWDAPSMYVDNKNVYFHANEDTPDKVPASTLRNYVQACAKIYNDINKLDLVDLEAPPSERPGAAEHDQGQ